MVDYFSILQMNWDEGNRLSLGSAIADGRTLYVDAWDHHTFLDLLFFSLLFENFETETVVVIVRSLNLAIAISVTAMSAMFIWRVIGDEKAPEQKRSWVIPAGLAWIAGTFFVGLFMFSRAWAVSTTGQLYHSLLVAVSFWILFNHIIAKEVYNNNHEHAVDKKLPSRAFFAGVLLALGFYIKQTAIFDAIAFILVFWILAYSRNQAKSVIKFVSFILAGALIVTAGFAVYFYMNGNINEVIYMTFFDPLVYATGSNIGDTINKYNSAFLSLLAYGFQVDVFLSGALIFSVAILLMRVSRSRLTHPAERLAVAALVWLIVNLIGIIMIGRFYPHYLVQVIMPAILLAPYFLYVIKKHYRSVMFIACSAWLMIHAVMVINSPPWRGYVELLDPENLQRTQDHIISKSVPGDGLYLYQTWALGLYFLTGRYPPVKNFMDHQLLPENKDAPELLQMALNRLEENPPKFIVWGNINRSVPEIDDLIEVNYQLEAVYGGYRIYSLKGNVPLSSAPR